MCKYTYLVAACKVLFKAGGVPNPLPRRVGIGTRRVVVIRKSAIPSLSEGEGVAWIDRYVCMYVEGNK